MARQHGHGRDRVQGRGQRLRQKIADARVHGRHAHVDNQMAWVGPWMHRLAIDIWRAKKKSDRT
ncbi:hypothetical protein B0H14DRAFT_3168175 [Mycena olivaceomarginata]|nr:hypothetical protein B0H14DRAFT_3168175 [Mycena olivaceomarginata]